MFDRTLNQTFRKCSDLIRGSAACSHFAQEVKPPIPRRPTETAGSALNGITIYIKSKLCSYFTATFHPVSTCPG